MEKWIFMVQSVCSDPRREEEFNHWYNTVHVPDLLTDPGIMRATRYVNKEPAEGQAKYVVIYEIETDDMEKTWQAHREAADKRKATGRLSPLIKVISSTVWKEMGPSREKGSNS